MAGLSKWFRFGRRARVPFKLLFARFRQLLDNNTRVLQIFADAAEKQSGEYVFDRTYVEGVVSELFELGNKIVYDLNSITDQRFAGLYPLLDQLRAEAIGDLSGRPVVPRTELCIPFTQIDESQVNLVGGKSAHLGEIASRLEVPIPEGFTITTHAYLRVIEENDLGPAIDAALARLADGDDRACLALGARLREARIPGDVRKAIRRALDAMLGRRRGLELAVRSSALGEDEDLSFAGQYHTVLQVSPDRVLDAYREVLASLYAPSAVAYRRQSGLPAHGLMAVACMRMVKAAQAGVLYTVDPNRPESGRMVIGAIRGLADVAVGGGQGMSTYELSREPPHPVLSYRPSTAQPLVVGRAAGAELAPAAAEGPELRDEDAATIAQLAERIERYFKQPQDIEWAREEDGRLYVIQARRLAISAPSSLPHDLAAQLESAELVLEGRGQVACRGVAAGRTHRLATLEDESALAAVPAGAVLVARLASPRLVRVMPRLAAILTEIGAPTGHMAALAREFRVPTIVDCGDLQALADGSEVTVDADDNRVYRGRIEPLLRYQLVEETGFEDAPEYRLLRRLLRRVTPLQLVDPQSEAFQASRCRSLHDVIRFAHEKSVEALIELHARGGVSGTEVARRLEGELPLNLQVIDIGGGLDPMVASTPRNAPVTSQAIRSAPMRALWLGLTAPGVWSTRPVGVDLRTFLSSAISPALTASSGRNLAVVSDLYVNLSLNLGYHYNMVDAFLCDDREANHIYFRFLGGASERGRRIRRAGMVREILERLDFAARQSGDLVVARLRKLPRAETGGRLEAIGRLIGFARQIDALMHSEERAMEFVDAFLRGDYTLE